MVISLNAISGGKAQIHAAGQVNTTEVVSDGVVRPYLIVFNTTASSYKLYTTHEITNGTSVYYNGAGTARGTSLGAIAGATPTGGVLYAAQWSGASAEMTDAQAYAVLNRLQYGIAGGATVDATSGWYCPVNLGEWTWLLAGTSLASPNYIWPCQESSGDLIEIMATNNMAAGGGTTAHYQQPIPGWSRRGVMLDASDTDVFQTGGTSQSRFFFGIVAFPATFPAGNQQSIMTLGGAFGTQVAANTQPSTAIMQLEEHGGAGNGGTSALGTQSVASTVRPVGLVANKTSNVARLQTDLESLPLTMNVADSPTRYAIGGDNVNYWLAASASFLYLAGWEGAPSEFSAADISTIISKIKNGH